MKANELPTPKIIPVILCYGLTVVALPGLFWSSWIQHHDDTTLLPWFYLLLVATPILVGLLVHIFFTPQKTQAILAVACGWMAYPFWAIVLGSILIPHTHVPMSPQVIPADSEIIHIIKNESPNSLGNAIQIREIEFLAQKSVAVYFLEFVSSGSNGDVVGMLLSVEQHEKQAPHIVDKMVYHYAGNHVKTAHWLLPVCSVPFGACKVWISEDRLQQGQSRLVEIETNGHFHDVSNPLAAMFLPLILSVVPILLYIILNSSPVGLLLTLSSILVWVVGFKPWLSW